MNRSTPTSRDVPTVTDGDPVEQSAARFDLRTIVPGLQSGFIATIVMTVFRMPISRSPPPTARFWAQYVAGGDPEEHATIGLLLHLGYGTAAGALFAAVFPPPDNDSTVESEAIGVLRGLAFSLALSAFGDRYLLEGLLDQELDADERFIFHLSHVVYGLTLGAWLGSTVD